MRKTRWAWYVLLCSAGVMSGEGLSWSTPFVFPIGIIVVVLYGLHYLLIIDFLLAKRAVTLRSLAIGGLVVGVTTESFLTKVIWNAPWNDGQMPRVLGIGVYEAGFIINVWHTWFSMAFPFALAYTLFGHIDLLEPRLRRRILWALPFTVLLVTVFNGVLWQFVVLPPVVNGLWLAVCIWVYQSFQRKDLFQQAEDFMLTKYERRVLWVLILTTYILLTPIGGKGLTAIDSLAALLIGLLWNAVSLYLLWAVRRADAGKMPPPGAVLFTYRDLFRYVLYFEAVAVMCALFTASIYWLVAVIVLGIVVIAGVIGNLWLLRLLWRTRAL